MAAIEERFALEEELEHLLRAYVLYADFLYEIYVCAISKKYISF